MDPSSHDLQLETVEVWKSTLDRLSAEVPAQTFDVWLADLACVACDPDGRTIRLRTNKEYKQRWIERQFASQIQRILFELTGVEYAVEVEVGGDPTPSPVVDPDPAPAASRLQPPAASDFAARRSPLAPPVPAELPWVSRLNPRYSFEEYVVGESNRFAHAAAQSVLRPDSEGFNPVFFYSQSGLGKTHLMHAVGHAMKAANPAAHVAYVTSEQFMNSFIESLQKNRMPEFRNRCRAVDLLLLDDVQFLVGKEGTQEEIFHTFNSLFDAGKKIVLSSDRPPKDLAPLEERLRSRFEWGVIADIQPPDLETRIAILRYKARQEGVAIPAEVAVFIAEHVSTNIRELEGTLKRVKMYASLHSAPMDLHAAREVLSHLVSGQNQRKVGIEDIQRAVCELFEIQTHQLTGSNRSKKFSQPRHFALYLCRELTDSSFPDIAQKFGGRDHTSVIYAYRKIKEQMAKDPNVAGMVNSLIRRIERGEGR